MTPYAQQRIKNNTGVEIDANFSVEPKDGSVTVVIESKGGGVNTPNKRNTDYNEGFQLLLERLALKSVIIDDVVVDSQVTQSINLSHQDRRLQLEGSYEFPFFLSNISDIKELRIALCAAQKPIGQSSGAIGGNGQKRIRIYVRSESGTLNVDTLGRELSFPILWAGISESELADAAEGANQNGEFDLDNIKDVRKRTLAAIVQRQGQPKFRKDLLKIYNGACAMTKCNLVAVLEAAHIFPFKGSTTNSVKNGLLLRADIHTLFDRGLISVNASDWTILVDRTLEATEYGPLKGQRLNLPNDTQFWPDIHALDFHRALSNL